MHFEEKANKADSLINIGLPMVTVEGKKYISMYNHEVTLQTVVIANPPVTFVYWEKVVNKRKTVINNGAVGIQEKPNVSVPFANSSVNCGDESNLVCNVDSSLPITIVHWERVINGVISRIYQDTIGSKGINADNPSLTILYSTNADSGLYT
ncbi:unnamed protein product [Mytilus coruscus]|uniref:Ig-like domain-containing protein n=1 Tax=Mytilus coruscus TaxID=42192 RepID=A0A6J8D945_MYTCO|nr:unnamed protein product [Mytilus coruscus]